MDQGKSQTQAVSVLTCINKFDKRAEGFRGHYDMLSERCHPNSLGHNFMFSELDRSDGTVRFCDEREPARNGQIDQLAALGPLPLVESIMKRLDELIERYPTFTTASRRSAVRRASRGRSDVKGAASKS